MKGLLWRKSGTSLFRMLDDPQKELAGVVSEMASAITESGLKALTFVQAVEATDKAILNYAASHAKLLEKRDAVEKKYPDWRSWWTALTCSRHEPPEHLDFNIVIEN